MHRLFFSFLLIFLPTQLGLHFWPEWATVLGRRVDYLSPTLYVTDILIMLTIGSWLMEEVFGDRRKVISQIIKFVKKHVPVLGLLLVFVVTNIFFASVKQVAFYRWMKFIEYFSLGFYVVKNRFSVSRITFCLSLSVFYSSLLAIGQFLLQHSVGGPLWFIGERTFMIDTPGIARFSWCQNVSASGCEEILRPYATFPHPNVLGGFLAVVLPIILASERQSACLPARQVRRSEKWIYRFALLFGIPALIVTFSRSAIVVGMIGMIWVLFHDKLKGLTRDKYIKILCTVLIVFCSFFIMRHSSFSIFSDESVVVRQQLNAAAITLWQHAPVAGVGLGNFLVELPKVLPQKGVYFLQPVHNIYLLVLSEAGVVGLGFFLWMILVVLRKGTSDKSQERSKGNTGNIPFSFFTFHFSLFSLLLLGLIDHYQLTLQQGQLFFVLILSFTYRSVPRKIRS